MSVSCPFTFLPRHSSPAQSERLKLDSTTPFIPTYVKRNLTASSDPSQTYASRVQGRQILLENPARESRAKKEREQKRSARTAARRAAASGGSSKKSGGRVNLKMRMSSMTLVAEAIQERLRKRHIHHGYTNGVLRESDEGAGG